MKLSQVAIRRPVFAAVMSLAILLFGLIAFLRLPVREYPDIDPPIISVVTTYRGASPNVIETEVTNVLEEQFATLQGVKTIQSSSKEEGSVITIEFELNRNVDEAANDVRERVSRVRGVLPREIDDPTISKVDANAQAVMWLALSSEHHSGLELTDVADQVLKDRLQRVPGVGSVILGGERRYAMRVWLDPLRLAAHGMTTQDVEDAVRQENAEIPSGRVEGKEREFVVRTNGELATADEFGSIIVSRKGDDIVRLRDVAQVAVGPADDRTAVRYNGQQAIGLGIVKQSKASTVDVAAAVKAALPDLVKLLPQGMKLDIAYDSSTFILDSIHEVQQTLIIAICLVVLVVLLFLKSMRATTIPTLAIPVSIIGALAAAYFAGFTLNILTLLGLVLAIGLVVDDAIVVLENVYRHMEMGKNRVKAAFDGSNEIGFAVVATTVALVAVFIPLAFLTGSVGRLFNEFGMTVAVAVLISGFVALTLTPMLTSKILKPLHHTSNSWASRSFDAFFDGLNKIYAKVLRGSLRRPKTMVAAAVLAVALSLVIFRLLPSELVPIEDRGYGFGVVMAPEGSTLKYTDAYMRQVEQRLLARPDVRAVFSATGLGFEGPGAVTDGFMFMALKPRNERAKSQQEIVRELFPQLISIPGVLAFVVNPPSIGGDVNSSPVEYVLEGDSYDDLSRGVGIMMGEASKMGYLLNLNSDLHLNKPQLDLAVDRDRASALGVSVSDIGSTLETLLGGRVVTNFKRGTKQYDVILQMKAADRSTPEVIKDVYVRSAGGLVQLANLVRVNETVAPKELNHFNRVRSATITANLAPGATVGQALDDLDHIMETKLPPGLKREFAGQSLEYKTSNSGLYLMFLLAIVFIFLVLSAQFESFIHPLTILLSVPLAVFGALLTLFVFRQSLNIYSQIGLIMLIGLVTKNAILIVEFANQLRSRGSNVVDAVIEAATIRLRPILMTSFATIFGVLPIAIGLGAGGESRQPLGLAVAGGLFFSTFLTLVIVPTVYTMLARFTKASAAGADGEGEEFTPEDFERGKEFAGHAAVVK